MKSVLLASSELGRPIDLKEVEAPQISPSLEAHFPGQLEEWRGLMQKVSEHNRNYKDFCQKIIETFESKRIPVEQNSQRTLYTCIYEAVFDPLFAVWERLARNEPPWVDFQEINSRQVEDGYLLYASGWGASAVGFAKTEDEREKCKLVLAQIADDMRNRMESAKIITSANGLVEEARQFAVRFATELKDIDKFWPGKKTSEFKALKKTCPTCKELF